MIDIINLRKEYPGVTPIKNITTTINKGDVISIIGPSGTGKSTFLRMLNMLERPTSGQIIVDGEDITAPGYPLHKVRQKIGMVFQSFNLFNNMTVIENVCFVSLYLKHEVPEDVFEKGMDLLEQVGLSNFAFSYPTELSGGQKQRVAIARTLANGPDVILFDEPTSALDPTMVGEVESVIKSVAAKGYTMLIVTHDMKFAEKVANRVFYLDEGGIYEDDRPEVIFKKPNKEKTKKFVKRMTDFEYVINEENKDFLPIQYRVESFCQKNEMPVGEMKKVKAIVEEALFNIALPLYRRCNSPEKSIVLRIEYSALLKDTRILIMWEDLEADYLRDEFEIPRVLIKHYADSISQIDGGIRIKVRE